MAHQVNEYDDETNFGDYVHQGDADSSGPRILLASRLVRSQRSHQFMKPGDKIVCVNLKPCWNNPIPRAGRLVPPLMLNQVYVVESVGRVLYGDIVNVIGVDPSPHRGFHPDRFRLLSEMKAEANAALKKTA